MAQMATVPVFACRGCGKPVYVVHLSSNKDDPDANLLKQLMQGLKDIALCKYCRMKYNWLASQGRSDEFSLNPRGVIYNVVDPSGVDYYRKKG
jgi:hypothetical protein